MTVVRARGISRGEGSSNGRAYVQVGAVALPTNVNANREGTPLDPRESAIPSEVSTT